MLISTDTKKQIDFWLKKYPQTHKQSGVMEALRLVQIQNNNTLNNELIQEVADYLDTSSIKVAEIASFYENYNLDVESHQYQIRICHNISCMLNGGDDLINHLENKLKVANGGITADGKFQLKKVECLGACVGSPMMQVGDTYYENLTINKIDAILESL